MENALNGLIFFKVATKAVKAVSVVHIFLISSYVGYIKRIQSEKF